MRYKMKREKRNNERIKLIGIYRSPSYNLQIFLQILQNILLTFKNNYNNFYIIGDLNVDLMQKISQTNNLENSFI